VWCRGARCLVEGAVFLIALVGFCPGRIAAQTNPSPESSYAPDQKQAAPFVGFSADATLVLIPVTVTDSSNRFVLGLQKQDFHLFEDGAEQTITHLSGEDAPLSIGLVFDISGSMDRKLRISRLAALQFVRTMNPEDEVLLVAFSDHAKLVSGFTSHIEELQNQLMALQPGGLTALLDAVEMGLEEMKNARNPRKAILVISDGGDNNSRYSSSQIQSLVREADVQLYAMGVFEPTLFIGMTKDEISGPRLLAEIAEQTGGRVFAATDPSDLPSVATRIGIELRNQYVLAYSPKNETKDGQYRKVEVKVAAPAGFSSLRLHWRLGYYAPLQ
jgi:Ca-activated chloride channel family protein